MIFFENFMLLLRFFNKCLMLMDQGYNFAFEILDACVFVV